MRTRGSEMHFLGGIVSLSSMQREIDNRWWVVMGGADGEGQWSGKAAALLAQMQNNYSQGNT